MKEERRAHPDCRNASNPYHECSDYCSRVIAEAKEKLSIAETEMKISDERWNILYKQCKPLVWVINKNTPNPDGYWFGFAIDGYLVTPAHCVQDTVDFLAFPLGREDDPYSAKVVLLKPMWDIAILQIEKVDGLNYSKFPHDCSLSVGQQLLHIGFGGASSRGSVMFECGNAVPSLDNEDLFCKNHVPKFFEEVPRHRTMAHVCNDYTWGLFYDEEYGPDHPQVRINSIAEYLHPQVPIIHMNDISSFFKGGTPLFNYEGEVVGMMVFDLGDLSKDGYAIHSSILKEALKEVQHPSGSPSTLPTK